ncbi:DUF3783 domain-containing protein [Clostridium sp. AL.422]|uniref:DUF3783 domain-containing protein n=1 Tax=Clostridium TaxID=1485 RepID=UPI00293DDA2F|nr:MULTISPECIES: DUF3783 domain-containing protein [unclassified Clostridium]MDV4149657.1 DUF3783 domain-containing protein [Clostridium sp. AL.422]
MSFELIDTKETKANDGRSCILLCNFNIKEIKTLSNLAAMLGIRDKVVLTYKNGNTLIKDVLSGNIKNDSEDGMKNKAIIFNNIPGAKIGFFIDSLKKFRLNNVLKAAVTETSQEWTVNVLLKNLEAEKIAMQTGQEFDHEE